MKRLLIFLLGIMLFLWECKEERSVPTIYEEAELFVDASSVDLAKYTNGKLKWQNFVFNNEMIEGEDKRFAPAIYRHNAINVTRKEDTPYFSINKNFIESMSIGITNPTPNSLYTKSVRFLHLVPKNLIYNKNDADTVKVLVGGSYLIMNYDETYASYELDTLRNDNYVKVEQYDKEKNIITGSFNLTFKVGSNKRFGDTYGALLPPEVSFRNVRFRSYFTRVPKKM